MFGRACGDYVSSSFASVGAEIDNVVGTFYYVEIMLDDDLLLSNNSGNRTAIIIDIVSRPRSTVAVTVDFSIIVWTGFGHERGGSSID